MSATNLLQAVSLLTDLVTVVNNLAQHAAQVSLAISRAQAEGRDLSDEEMASIRALDDAARAKLDAVILSKGG